MCRSLVLPFGFSRIATAIALVLAPGGCAVYQPQASSTVALYADRSVTAAAVPVSSAAATLPQSAGRIVLVSESRFSDGVSQEIILAGDRGGRGENRIDVAYRLQAESELVTENKVPMARPTDTGVAAEMERLFPGIDMQTVPVLLQNAYGPYGLAAGRRGESERCIYAWQWIEDGGNLSSSLRGTAFAVFLGTAPVSVRIRLCRSDASADQLAALLNDLVIGGVRQTNAVAPARGGDALSVATGGGAGFDGYQLPRALTPAPLPANDGFVARPARRQAARSHAPVRHRRQYWRRAAEPQAAAVYNEPSQQRQFYPQPYAPRQYPPQAAYPMQQPVMQQMYAPPVYAPQQTGIKPLDPNLPPQAYRGPATSAAARVPLLQQSGAVQYNAPGQAPVLAAPQGARLMRDPAPGV